MPELTASRTLVKSGPELWAECSDAASLAKHLGAFGEIRITKLEPETAVAWEGAAARGTVRLEPAGWGTRVVLTATQAAAMPDAGHPEEAAGAQAAPEAPDAAVVEIDTRARRSILTRVFFWRSRRSIPRVPEVAVAEPTADPEAPPSPQPQSEAGQSAAGALDRALDSLGRAHHRPYSRA